MANRHAAACAIRAGSIPGATIGRSPVIPQRLPRRKHGACGTGNQSRIRAALNLASQTQREIQRKSKSFSTVQSRIRTAANQSQIRERERRDRQRERERERERESCTGSTQNLLNASSSLSLFL